MNLASGAWSFRFELLLRNGSRAGRAAYACCIRHYLTYSERAKHLMGAVNWGVTPPESQHQHSVKTLEKRTRSRTGVNHFPSLQAE